MSRPPMTSAPMQWHPGHAAGALGLDARALDWVLEPGSMTARLRRDFPALAALHDAAVRHVRLILDT